MSRHMVVQRCRQVGCALSDQSFIGVGGYEVIGYVLGNGFPVGHLERSMLSIGFVQCLFWEIRHSKITFSFSSVKAAWLIV